LISNNKSYEITFKKSHSLRAFQQYQDLALISLQFLVLILLNIFWQNNSICSNSCIVCLKLWNYLDALLSIKGFPMVPGYYGFGDLNLTNKTKKQPFLISQSYDSQRYLQILVYYMWNMSTNMRHVSKLRLFWIQVLRCCVLRCWNMVFTFVQVRKIHFLLFHLFWFFLVLLICCFLFLFLLFGLFVDGCFACLLFCLCVSIFLFCFLSC